MVGRRAVPYGIREERQLLNFFSPPGKKKNSWYAWDVQSSVICTELGPRGRKGQEVSDGVNVVLVSLVPLTTD